MIYFLFFLDGNKEEYIMAVHYLISDEVAVFGEKVTYKYHTFKDVQHLEDVWETPVDIVDPYGDHQLSGFIPDNWEITEESGSSPVNGYRLPKYSGCSINDNEDDSIWGYLHCTSMKDVPQEVGIYRTVYELKGGEMPISVHVIE